ncbi:MAG: adenylate/guanylate cyclase domain-containing protein [Verrucomicrobiia bacterium]
MSTESSPELGIARIQYVYLDIVDFTINRNIEAQSEVLNALNRIVNDSVKSMAIEESKVIIMPTGDGMAIALLLLTVLDAHLQLALKILDAVAANNKSAVDPMLRFEVRIGINENVDNVVRDINGRPMAAGAGISMAQRIMDKADGGQIIVGSAVHDTLCQRKKYATAFREYQAIAKHGVKFTAYQYIEPNLLGLNAATPSAFETKKSSPAKLTRIVAYYIAHGIRNREFLVSRKKDPKRSYVATVLLGFLAMDSEDAATTPRHENPTLRTWGAGAATFQKQYEFYNDVDFWIMARLAEYFGEKHLSSYRNCFIGEPFETEVWLVSTKGVQKLLAEWPAIAKEFEITAS